MENYERPDTTGQRTGATGSVQGEGDYRSAREYREDVQEFLQRADVDKAARDAAPRNPAEARALEQAEQIGRSHAKGISRRTDPGGMGLAGSIGRAVQARPMTAIVIAGVLGYLAVWRPRLRRRARASRGT